MSRIGRKTIQIPQGVEVTASKGLVKVKGPKGELTQQIKGSIRVEVANNQVTVLCDGTEKQDMAYWGLYRSLINNMVKGVSEGFKKNLEIVGVGYRAAQKGKDLSISVGYSKPVEFKAPEGITLSVEENVKISVSGVNKDLVGLTSAKIRAIRKPEPYKGKGIKYSTEVVRRKAGKAGGKAAA